MQFQLTTEHELSQVMDILRQAQHYFKEAGIDQWQDGYPDEETIRQDLRQGHAWVMMDSTTVIGCMTVSFDGDSNYDQMEEGCWLTDRPYAVIHRIAVRNDRKGQGLADQLLRQAEQLCSLQGISSLRVDTHQDNRSMRRLLDKNGYQYCGVIRLQRDQSLRVAYEKRLDER